MAITPISPAAGNAAPTSVAKVQPVASNKFENFISKLVQGANENQTHADQSIQKLASGETDNLHDVVMSVAKADMSFRMLLEIRNRLIDSYQELMRMQV